MNPTRYLLPAMGAVVLLASGCNRRGDVEVAELRSENQRLTSEMDKLYKRAELLEQQRNAARDELVRYREQAEGLSKQLRERLSGAGIAGIEVTEEGSLALDQDFAFDKGSAELNEGGRNSIGQLARMLQSGEYAGTKVIVMGHTDTTPVVRPETKGKYGDNWGLSAMRAASVIRALQSSGIQPSRLHGAFRGEHAPRADNGSTAGKAKNRRVEIFLSL